MYHSHYRHCIHNLWYMSLSWCSVPVRTVHPHAFIKYNYCESYSALGETLIYYFVLCFCWVCFERWISLMSFICSGACEVDAVSRTCWSCADTVTCLQHCVYSSIRPSHVEDFCQTCTVFTCHALMDLRHGFTWSRWHTRTQSLIYTYREQQSTSTAHM